MQSRLQRLGAISALLWCLAGAAFAAPRVAIITPLGGDVWLGETRLTTPRIAEEGQKLVLGENGQVRVQLLGSSKEKVIKGNALLVINKADLEKDSQIISRGTIAIADEIGNISTSASANSRVGSVDKNYVVGFAVAFPAQPAGEGWAVKVSSLPEQFPKEGVTVTVVDLTEGAPGKELGSMPVPEFTPSLEFPEGTLLPGHRYSLVVQGPDSGYNRQFQVLSQEERAELQETARAMRVEALETDELALLLRLANFYSSFDENEKMADVLIEVVNKPSFEQLDQQQQEKVKKALNLTLRSLDRRNYEGELSTTTP